MEEEGQLRPAGIIEFVPANHRKAFHSVKDHLITGKDKKFVYVEPSIKAKVKFRNWMHNGLLRTPALVDFVI